MGLGVYFIHLFALPSVYFESQGVYEPGFNTDKHSKYSVQDDTVWVPSGTVQI